MIEPADVELASVTKRYGPIVAVDAIGLIFNILSWEMTWYSSPLGAHLTWTLPFDLLIMFAVFNRFDRSDAAWRQR
jgi:hypothetical protein